MELVGMLRILARHRWLLGVGAVLALTAAVLTLYRVTPGLPPTIAERGSSSSVATAQALLAAADGGSYQLDSRIATTIPARARTTFCSAERVAPASPVAVEACAA